MKNIKINIDFAAIVFILAMALLISQCMQQDHDERMACLNNGGSPVESPKYGMSMCQYSANVGN